MDKIRVGYQAFTDDGGEEFGAIRYAYDDRDELTVYVENAGDFVVSRAAVLAVHDQKVIFDCKQLDAKLRKAIGHAHDAEQPGF